MRDYALSRLRQAALCAAVLLHLVGAAVLPALHDVVPPPVPEKASATALAPAGGDAELPFPADHDEATCLVCQAAGAAFVLPSGAVPLPDAVREIVPFSSAPHSEPALRGTGSLARAPPALL